MFYPATLPLSGDPRIDGLLEAVYPSLAMNRAVGTAALVTYSFLEQVPAPGSSPWTISEFRPLNQVQRDGVNAMLAEISTVTGIAFREVDSGGLLRYGLDAGYTTADGMLAKGYSRTDPFAADPASYVWLNHHVAEVARLDVGYGRMLALHETAHGLGLKHPQHYGSYDSGPELPADLANARYTVMAYAGGSRNDLGELDILALKYLYGEPGMSAAEFNRIDVAGYLSDVAAWGSFFNDFISLSASSLRDTSPVIHAGTGDDVIRIIDLVGLEVQVVPLIDGGPGLDSLWVDVARLDVRLGKTADAPPSLDYNSSSGSGRAFIYLDQVERIRFSDTALALDVEDGPGKVFRLYQAAFDRTPDKGGLGYWIARNDAGLSLHDIGIAFIASREFAERYGHDTRDDVFINAPYQNVLDRTGDPQGLAYWGHEIESGSHSRGEVLIGFSESLENVANLIGVIGQSIEYTYSPL